MKEGEIMNTCVCYFLELELELLFCCFLAYSYNCLAPQPVPELMEAGARVYIKKDRAKSNDNLQQNYKRYL